MGLSFPLDNGEGVDIVPALCACVAREMRRAQLTPGPSAEV